MAILTKSAATKKREMESSPDSLDSSCFIRKEAVSRHDYVWYIAQMGHSRATKNGSWVVHQEHIQVFLDSTKRCFDTLLGLQRCPSGALVGNWCKEHSPYSLQLIGCLSALSIVVTCFDVIVLGTPLCGFNLGKQSADILRTIIESQSRDVVRRSFQYLASLDDPVSSAGAFLCRIFYLPYT